MSQNDNQVQDNHKLRVVTTEQDGRTILKFLASKQIVNDRFPLISGRSDLDLLNYKDNSGKWHNPDWLTVALFSFLLHSPGVASVGSPGGIMTVVMKPKSERSLWSAWIDYHRVEHYICNALEWSGKEVDFDYDPPLEDPWGNRTTQATKVMPSWPEQVNVQQLSYFSKLLFDRPSTWHAAQSIHDVHLDLPRQNFRFRLRNLIGLISGPLKFAQPKPLNRPESVLERRWREFNERQYQKVKARCLEKHNLPTASSSSSSPAKPTDD